MGAKKLTDQIELLRRQMLDEHAGIMAKVGELDHLVFDNDVELMRSLQGIIEGQGVRAADIHRAMEVIRSRIGYPVGGPQRAAGGVLDDHGSNGARTMAERFSPPLRAESTAGDELGLYPSGNTSFGLN